MKLAATLVLLLLAIPCGAESEPQAAFVLGCLEGDDATACFAGYGTAIETSIPRTDLVGSVILGEAEQIEFAMLSLALRVRWGGDQETPGKPRWSIGAGMHGTIAARPVDQFGLGLYLARTNYGPGFDFGQDWPHCRLKPGWRFHQQWQRDPPRAGIRGLCLRVLFIEGCLDQVKLAGKTTKVSGLKAFLPVGWLKGRKGKEEESYADLARCRQIMTAPGPTALSREAALTACLKMRQGKR